MPRQEAGAAGAGGEAAAEHVEEESASEQEDVIIPSLPMVGLLAGGRVRSSSCATSTGESLSSVCVQTNIAGASLGETSELSSVRMSSL